MKNTNFKNRGMFLENIINDSNTYYNSIDRCLIFKKPTPIKVLNVSYPSNTSHVIDRAVYSSISTLDYNGIYKEKYIEFDAKECHSKTSFPLSNIKEHQLEHIKKVIKQKGIVFLIIYMNNEFFLLKGEDVVEYILNNDRKSIEFDYIKDKGYRINESYLPRLKYLDTVDIAYF
ncbi:MAG: Holliday junction resolvase RecU [Bacilli bacterium]|nr:Holliday junction resolvase RecU [Bacilli bacterium]